MTDTVVLRNVRIAYPELFTPAEFKGSVRYSAQIIIEKADKAQMKLITDAIEFAKKATWPKGAPMRLDTALHDGAESNTIGGDNMFVRAYRSVKQGAPTVLGKDSRKGPITQDNPHAPYSGCYVDAKIQFWGQDQTKYGKNQVNCTLLVVQFRGEGERLSSSKITYDEFEPVQDNVADFL